MPTSQSTVRTDKKSASLAKSMSSGIVWNALNFLGSQGAGFAVFLILATRLDPFVFGIVALASIIADIIAIEGRTAGMDAIVQGNRYDRKTLNSAFAVMMGVAITFTVSLILIAPMMADYYQSPLIKAFMPVFALILLPVPWLAVMDALIMKDLGFKVQTQRNMAATILGGVTGIAVAFSPFSIWALVVQRVVALFTALVFQYAHTRWAPLFALEKADAITFAKRYFPLWSIITLNLSIPRAATLVFGARYGTETVGLLRAAYRIEESARGPLVSPLQGLWFPLMAKVRGNKKEERHVYDSIVKTSAFLALPAFTGLLIVAHDVVDVILPDAYSGVAPLIQAVCLTSLLIPLNRFNSLALGSLDENRKSFFVTLTNVLSCIAALLTFPHVTPFWALLIMSAPSVLVGLISAHIVHMRVGQNPFLHYLGLSPAYLAAGIMGAVVWYLQREFSHIDPVLRLIVCVSAGGIVYAGWLFGLHPNWTQNRIAMLRGKSI